MVQIYCNIGSRAANKRLFCALWRQVFEMVFKAFCVQMAERGISGWFRTKMFIFPFTLFCGPRGCTCPFYGTGRRKIKGKPLVWPIEKETMHFLLLQKKLSFALIVKKILSHTISFFHAFYLQPK